jgi:hypothetical protein
MLAASKISPYRRDLQALGGSNVQRELFELIFADSVIHCRDSLAMRKRVKPAAAFDVAA